MIKDVLISIIGTQGIDDDVNTIELTTDGRFGTKDGSYFISYDESKLLGVKNVKTMLYIKPDNSIVLQRSGSMQSRLIIKKGIRNTCFYSTTQGEFVIGIFGETVEHNLSSSGGDIKMSYTLDSNLNLISRNVVNISIKEVSKDVDTCSKN